MEQEALLNIGDITLLPDTSLVLHGESFSSFLGNKEECPNYGQTKRGRGRPLGSGGPPKRSIHYSAEEIENNPVLALSPELYRTLRLHIAGLSTSRIAEILGGITEAAVRMRLNKYVVKRAKVACMANLDQDIQSLSFKALEVYREGIDHKDYDTRLKVADRVMKMNKLDGTKDAEGPSRKAMGAEEMIQQMINIKNLQVNVTGTGAGERSEQKSANANIDANSFINVD